MSDAWKTDPTAAFAEAERRIDQVRDGDEEVLDLSDLRALGRLPDMSGLLSLQKAYLGGRSKDRLLQLHSPRLQDISALQDVPDLRELDLSFKPVSDIGVLSGLTGLTWLDLSGTEVSDIGVLSGLTRLTWLDISGTEVIDIGVLSDLTGLTSLDLSATAVSDIGVLSGLTGLTSLRLPDTGVSDIGVLSGLTGLTSLDLSGTGVSDIGVLSGMTGLTSLALRRTGVREIGVLLDLPDFAEERAQFLSYEGIPLCETDRRLDMLSRLPPDRCARETVQYMKGTHPDFRPPEVVGPSTVQARLEAGQSLDLKVQDDHLSVMNMDGAERVAPQELADRLTALRMQTSALLEEAAQAQIPSTLVRRLERYAHALEREAPTYLILDGPMAVLKGSISDPYVVAALDQGFVEGWQYLIDAHDALRELVLPRAPELPTPRPDVTPEEGIALVEEAVEAATPAVDDNAFDETLVETLAAIRDYFEAAKSETADKPGLIRRGLGALGELSAKVLHVVSLSSGVATLTQWFASAQGQAFIVQMRALLDKLLA
ncbi:MAG: leucine-rich repeat domain-containing protein, partial [Pseudomonadota bacterium]